ncbi:hypothetical protein H4Q32_000647 [Labeo rohita]|uniref:Uncharacterized protein n=1 Tax=Labeo rohita TaxID=84645 RepID=A0ABQ8LIX3_LABRO|nr:hypothetical protein H4Q32_000647 [Labeo rohita]
MTTHLVLVNSSGFTSDPLENWLQLIVKRVSHGVLREICWKSQE